MPVPRRRSHRTALPVSDRLGRPAPLSRRLARMLPAIRSMPGYLSTPTPHDPILTSMTQASARTPWNWESSALIQHWLEAGVRALIELVRNLFGAQQPSSRGATRTRDRATSGPPASPHTCHHGQAKRDPQSKSGKLAAMRRVSLHRIPREGGGPAGERRSPHKRPERPGATPQERPLRVLTGSPPSRGKRDWATAPQDQKRPQPD